MEINQVVINAVIVKENCVCVSFLSTSFSTCLRFFYYQTQIPIHE